ncbi:MAG TPA: hypothetical protein VLJ14_04070, partial [Ktedonobacterales bacterium]|nr:hypothetical protein [Ktedonobacterales bacterium]
MQAEDEYRTAGSGLGQAESNRVLGAVNLRRGQYAQAIAVFDRAARALTAQRARVPYAHATLGSAEAHRRKANPRKAEDLFADARIVGSEVEQPAIEAAAILGLGQIARLRGQSADAASLLDEADARLERHARPALAAHAILERARLALTAGEFDHAGMLVERARTLTAQAEEQTGEAGPASTAARVAEDLALALGQLPPALASAAAALDLAGREADVLPMVDALLGLAEAMLRSDDLDAAIAAFNRVLDHPQAAEAALPQALAALGLARILLRRGLYEEAALQHQELLPRFKSADAPAALALAQLGIGDARLQLGEYDAARQAYAEAARLYMASGDVPGTALAAEHEGGLLLETGELEAAVGRFSQAIATVERLSANIADGAARASYFDARAPLYVAAIHAWALESNAARAQEIAASYAGQAARPGRAAAGQRLREIERAIPTRGADLTKEQIERNKAIQRILADARKALSK